MTDTPRLTEPRAHFCRWPIGEPSAPGFGFCGIPTHRTYCTAHHARAVDPSRPKLNVKSTMRLANMTRRVVRERVEAEGW